MCHADDSNGLLSMGFEDRVRHVHIPLSDECLRVPVSPSCHRGLQKKIVYTHVYHVRHGDCVGGCPHLASIAVSLCLCVSFCPSVTLCKHFCFLSLCHSVQAQHTPSLLPTPTRLFFPYS